MRITAAVGGELAVPADIAELLGADAELTIGADQVVRLRPAKLSSAVLAADVQPLEDPAQLCHATSELTPQERSALADFLAA
ncbi:MAG: hypothetical protein FWD74_07545 [Actinomycetia bacterium]|nr:hypothetical protein [Actinomycetes bacterium]